MFRTTLVASVVASGLLLAGCGRDSGRLTDITSPRPLAQGSASTASIDYDALTYEVISGTLSPGESGVMYATLKTWDKNCQVALIVPAESMPPDGPPINFTMSFPTKASYLAHPELDSLLVVRLAPDGQQFLGPITIQATWMPWQGDPPNPVFGFVLPGLEPVPATRTYVPSINRWRITFAVNHFSDWGAGPEPRNHLVANAER